MPRVQVLEPSAGPAPGPSFASSEITEEVACSDARRPHFFRHSSSSRPAPSLAVLAARAALTAIRLRVRRCRGQPLPSLPPERTTTYRAARALYKQLVQQQQHCSPRRCSRCVPPASAHSPASTAHTPPSHVRAHTMYLGVGMWGARTAVAPMPCADPTCRVPTGLPHLSLTSALPPLRAPRPTHRC